ncbi:MAG: PLDc N-terminal domain-containing protein [Micrococcus sp.]|nr:PLDc N-terminal domain-containing protein [Micrococcus sp.]
MPRFLIPLGIVAVGVIIYAFIECLMTPKHQVRAFPKAAWALIILLVPLLGALLWLFLGRVRSRRGGAGGAPGARPAAPRRPSSPDDDAAFLRQLDIQRQQQARQAELDRREAELKAREHQTGETAEKPEDGGPATS